MFPSDQQGLDGAATRDSMAKQPRWKDPGVVDHDQIARSQESRKVGNVEVPDLTAVPRQVHQSGIITLWRGLLSDEI